MILILLEAILALGFLLFAVWWTMFSGRKKDPKNTIKDVPDSPHDANQDNHSGQ